MNGIGKITLTGILTAIGTSDFGATFSDEPLKTYHKGYDKEQRKTANRNRMRDKRGKDRSEALVIAWDGEGIDLFGPGRPQSYVLFGCSAEWQNPLLLRNPQLKLSHKQLCEYICDVGSRNPGAIHIGYGFAYDQNMLIQTMPLKMKERLYHGEWVSWKHGDWTYKLKIEWRKRFKLTRIRTNSGGERTTVYIDDIAAFFHSPFTKAYEKIVGKDADSVVVSGKANRGTNEWRDLPVIKQYWQAEIVALAELGTRFRDILYDAGFALSEFYGPGALANYLRRREGLVTHEWGGKESNLPTGVHTAAKSAFYGGRFEQFLLGRIPGPVFSLDINSAYPYAFCSIPTLKKGGFWQHVTDFERGTFSVYRIRYCDSEWVNELHGNPRRSPLPHPFPYRNSDSEISYPALTEGWYWEPEVSAGLDCFPGKVEIYEGWVWRPVEKEYPWKILMEDMFRQRLELKRSGQITEMAYKLGINSLYGKMAQRVGWNKEKKVPPGSHTLPIAGYVTSFCRAMITRVVKQIGVHSLVAIETDGIYTTVNPAHLELPTGIGDWLGQWELETYDEMYYVQNGVYFARKGCQWVKAKSRGFPITLVSPESTKEYLQSLVPHTRFQAMEVSANTSNFIGIGLALGRARNGKGHIVPSKAQVLHCQWEKSSRTLIPGGKGKRIHVPAYCPACESGNNALEQPHLLVSNHGAIGKSVAYVLSKGETKQPKWNPFSQSYRLPWETPIAERWRVKAQEDEERIEQIILGKVPELSV